MVKNRSSGDGVSGSSPPRATFHQPFNFSINDHSKYQNTVFFYFQIDKQEQIFKNFRIRNYFIFHLITAVVLLISIDLLTCSQVRHRGKMTRSVRD